MAKEKIQWPSDPYECPYCFNKFSSIEKLIEHFDVNKHPKKYISQRFRIDLNKRKQKLHKMTTSSKVTPYKSPSVHAISVSFESNKQKH